MLKKNVKGNIIILAGLMLLALISCSNPALVSNGDNTGLSQNKEQAISLDEYYVHDVDFNDTKRIAQTYLQNMAEFYDWKEAQIGKYYPIYNPATEKITYLEYKVTKKGINKGYILITLKDDEPRVVESSHGDNGTCFEYLSAKAKTDKIKVSRFSFDSYVAEDNTQTNGKKRILSACGGIEEKIGNNLDSDTAINKYNESIENYKKKINDNGGFLDIKKQLHDNSSDNIDKINMQYGILPKNKKANMSRGTMSYNSGEIQWYANSNVSSYSVNSTKMVSSNTAGWTGSYITIRYYFLDYSYQDIDYYLYLSTPYQQNLRRTDVLEATFQRFSGYGNSSTWHQLYLCINGSWATYSINFWTNSMPQIGAPVYKNHSAIKYPLLRTQQYFMNSSKTESSLSGCVPTAGAIILAYWSRIFHKSGLWKNNISPVNEIITEYYLTDTQSAAFQLVIQDLRQRLHMTQNGTIPAEVLAVRLSEYSAASGYGGLFIEWAGTGDTGTGWGWQRLINFLNADYPAYIGYTETQDANGSHGAVVYKVVVSRDWTGFMYDCIYSVDAGFTNTNSPNGNIDTLYLDAPYTKDIPSSSFAIGDLWLMSYTYIPSP